MYAQKKRRVTKKLNVYLYIPISWKPQSFTLRSSSINFSSVDQQLHVHVILSFAELCHIIIMFCYIGWIEVGQNSRVHGFHKNFDDYGSEKDSLPAI